MKTKISVFIITFNEEDNIFKCLEKLLWADEIIIVDSGSTDKTVEICKQFQTKVIYNKFENYGIQKQFALDNTNNEWVLSLDADEVLSDKLIDEICNLNFIKKGYKIPRTHVFLNRIFKYGSENKKPILRLFNKRHGRFKNDKIHETIIVNGSIGYLKNEMLHYTASNISIAVHKMIDYSILSGELLFEKNKKITFIKPIFKIPFKFIGVYFFQLNFMNGFHGFIWSVIYSFGVFLKYVKLLELQSNK